MVVWMNYRKDLDTMTWLYDMMAKRRHKMSSNVTMITKRVSSSECNGEYIKWLEYLYGALLIILNFALILKKKFLVYSDKQKMYLDMA